MEVVRDIAVAAMRRHDVADDATVYHYTGTEGLLGIIRDGAFRATNFRYLNDSSEFLHGLEIVRGLAAAHRARRDGDRRSTWLELLAAMADVVASKSNLYVTCFSSLADDLSQWRSYGTPGADKFCLGFTAGLLRLTCGGKTCSRSSLSRVTYNQQEQQAEIMALAQDLTQELGNVGQQLSETTVGRDVASMLLDICAVYKNAAFVAEQESRTVHTVDESEPDIIEFYSVSGRLRPYITARSRIATLPLIRVIILPASFPDQALRSTQLLLAKHGYSPSLAELSPVPYVG